MDRFLNLPLMARPWNWFAVGASALIFYMIAHIVWTWTQPTTAD